MLERWKSGLIISRQSAFPITTVHTTQAKRSKLALASKDLKFPKRRTTPASPWSLGHVQQLVLPAAITQGGGHSELASKYGLAADQTLEWEVITGTGDFVTASPTQNADLYWALSGGGGGTYGIVYSLTSKAHRDTPVSGASLSFYRKGLSTDTYYAGLTAWHKNLPNVVDAGIATDYTISKDFFRSRPFHWSRHIHIAIGATSSARSRRLKGSWHQLQPDRPNRLSKLFRPFQRL